mgnify:CR=1 FL=1
MIEGNAHDKEKGEKEMARTKQATPVADEVEGTEPGANTENMFSAKDLAAELGIDPKAFRRWLRGHTTARANKGGRWLFTAETKAQMIDAYKARVNKGTEPVLEGAEG